MGNELEMNAFTTLNSKNIWDDFEWVDIDDLYNFFLREKMPGIEDVGDPVS